MIGFHGHRSDDFGGVVGGLASLLGVTTAITGMDRRDGGGVSGGGRGGGALRPVLTRPHAVPEGLLLLKPVNVVVHELILFVLGLLVGLEVVLDVVLDFLHLIQEIP